MDAFERAHFLFSETNQCNIGLIATLKSPLLFERLKEGVYALTKRHFLLRSRIEKSSFTFKETQAMPEVVFLKKRDEKACKSTLDCIVNQPFTDPFSPLFRVAYLSGDAQDTLLLSMHHAIGDGMTLFLILQELLTYSLNQSLPPPCAEIVSVEARVLQESSCEPNLQAPLTLHPNRPIQKSQFLYKTLEAPLTKKFLQSIRNKGLTFQSAFSAIVLQEFFRQKQAEQVYYTCPINIRNLIGMPPASLGCQITLLDLLIDRKGAASPNLLSHFIQFKLQSLIHHRPTLFQNLFNLLSGHSEKTTPHLPQIGISNVGPIQLPDHLHPIGIESIHINGSLGRAFAFHPVVCTFQNRLHLTFCFSPTFFTLETAERLCNQIISSMQVAASLLS